MKPWLGALYLAACLTLPQAQAISAPLAEAQAPAGFVVHASPRPVPEIAFRDGQGDPRSLADFRGRVVLLNIWATWCAPCRREMPTLDSLQSKLGGPDFEVVALSVDRQGRTVVVDFYHELGLRQLGVYVDPSGKAQRDLKVLGIPTTLLLDREGKEIGRLLGPAEWDSPAMVAFIRHQIQQPSGPSLREISAEQLASNNVRQPIADAGLRKPLPSSDWKAPTTAR